MQLLDMLSGFMSKPLGTGLAQQAADINSMYPVWQKLYMQAQSEGMPFPQFKDWVSQQGMRMGSMK